MFNKLIDWFAETPFRAVFVLAFVLFVIFILLPLTIGYFIHGG